MARAKQKSKATYSGYKRGRLTVSSSRASSSRGRSYSRSRGKETAERRPRKRKDKSRPKRALGPYMYFCKEQRKEIQNQNPSLSFGDIGRVLGSQWGRLNEREKQKYVRKAESDKKRYAKEMKRYKPRH